MSTVAKNMEVFTKKEVKDANDARRGLELVGYPSERDFTDMVRSNMIHNCDITTNDIKNAQVIFGPDVLSLKCKSVRQTPATVVPACP